MAEPLAPRTLEVSIVPGRRDCDVADAEDPLDEATRCIRAFDPDPPGLPLWIQSSRYELAADLHQVVSEAELA